MLLTSVISRVGRPPRHQEGINVSYADGHARYLKAIWNMGLDTWVVASGPYAGLFNLKGIVMDDGTLWVP